MSDIAISVGEKKKDGEYDKYELESACDTLTRAEEIKADKKLMKALGPYLEKKKKAITSIEELRGVARKKILEDKSEY